ncbi:MAG: site-specific DNA-methyltransferase [Candidatus Magnetoovum sp. WYHC-5]|nr:site-specific DNA-methyltransferase [Candidatus Magnetoovum sp. WYHC-5]
MSELTKLKEEINNNGISTFYEHKDYDVKLIKGDCITYLNSCEEETVDMIFADPPYFLSNGGVTCHAGQMVTVNKGVWDKSRGIDQNHEFNLKWLKACQQVLKSNGTIWVSGTAHNIYSIGFAMQQLGYKILNDIVWYKRNAPPNLSCRYFTHSSETILWALKNEKGRHFFNYKLMKEMNFGKQMRNVWGLDIPSKETPSEVWEISAPSKEEKRHGKHPTQKPIALLKRIILSSTKENDLVLDPFCGSASSGVASVLLNRKYIGIELKEDYLELSKKRFDETINNILGI